MLDYPGFVRWRAEYDAAGITARDQPPESLLKEVEQAAIVAASDLPRARESAERLARGRPVVVSTHFREIPLPVPSWMLVLRAPRAVWDLMAHLQWSIDILRGQEAPPGSVTQVRHAVAWLRDACERVAAENATVAVVTHGVIRRLLALELTKSGWRADPGRRRYVHWSVWRFSNES